MKTVWIGTDSPLFPSWVDLRQRVLRDPLGLRYTVNDLAAERTQRHLLALGERGDVIGGLAIAPLSGEPTTWKIRQVAVDPDLQGRGLGRELMSLAIREAVEFEVSEVVLHSRADVVPFYEKLGFSADGDEFEEVGVPHRKMVLSLSRA